MKLSILIVLLIISTSLFSQFKIGMIVGSRSIKKQQQVTNNIMGETLNFNIIKVETTKSNVIKIYTNEQNCKKIQTELDNKLKNKLDDLTIIKVYVLNNNYTPKTCIILKTDCNELDIDEISLNDYNDNIQ